MRRILAIFTSLAFFVGAVAFTHAQIPLTGAGRGAPGGGGGGGGNVAPDVLGTTKFQSASNSFSYTGLTITGGLTNPGLVCMVLRAHGTNDIEAGLSLTWGAQSMVLRKVQDGGATTKAAFLFGLRNPTSGNQTLAVAATNVATDNFVNCVSFSNVNQTSDAAAFPNPTGDGTGLVSTIVVTSANGHIAVGAFYNGSGVGTILGTTVITDQTSGALIAAMADYVVSSGASTTIGSSVNSLGLAGMDVSN